MKLKSSACEVVKMSDFFLVTANLSTSDVNLRDGIVSLPFLLQDSVNTFNTKLFKSLAEFEFGNIIYSPFFLHMILSLAYVGAPLNTIASEEMAKLLGFEPSAFEMASF